VLRLFGCYEALKGGNQAEAMEDFTGGITESVDFRKKDKVPADLHLWMEKALARGSLIGCGIDVSGESRFTICAVEI
jgi:hypothetical protein